MSGTQGMGWVLCLGQPPIGLGVNLWAGCPSTDLCCEPKDAGAEHDEGGGFWNLGGTQIRDFHREGTLGAVVCCEQVGILKVLKKRRTYVGIAIKTEPIIITLWVVKDLNLVDGRTGWDSEVRCVDVCISGEGRGREAGSVDEW